MIPVPDRAAIREQLKQRARFLREALPTLTDGFGDDRLINESSATAIAALLDQAADLLALPEAGAPQQTIALDDAIAIVQRWHDAYPVEVFGELPPPPKPGEKEIASRDCIAAAHGRHMAKRLIEELREAGADAASVAPEHRITAENLYESIGGDLCICQRSDVSHWCETCQHRIQLIQEALRAERPAAGPADLLEFWRSRVYHTIPAETFRECFADLTNHGWDDVRNEIAAIREVDGRCAVCLL